MPFTDIPFFGGGDCIIGVATSGSKGGKLGVATGTAGAVSTGAGGGVTGATGGIEMLGGIGKPEVGCDTALIMMQKICYPPEYRVNGSSVKRELLVVLARGVLRHRGT